MTLDSNLSSCMVQIQLIISQHPPRSYSFYLLFQFLPAWSSLPSSHHIICSTIQFLTLTVLLGNCLLPYSLGKGHFASNNSITKLNYILAYVNILAMLAWWIKVVFVSRFHLAHPKFHVLTTYLHVFVWQPAHACAWVGHSHRPGNLKMAV